MTINEAMDILDLKAGFTNEELDKNYKRKMMEWHPDVCKKPNAEQIAKKINEARNILRISKKNNDSYEYNYEDTNFIMMREKYFKDLEYISILGFDISSISDADYNTASTATLLAMLLMSARIDMGSINSIEKLNKLYNEYKEKIFQYIVDYVKSFCAYNGLKIYHYDERNFIIEKDYTINIEKGFYNVYDCLQKIKNESNILKRTFVKVKSLFR